MPPPPKTSILTSRLVIVVTPEAKQLVNDTLRNVDPTSVGDPLVRGLRVAGPAPEPWTGDEPPPEPDFSDVDNTIVAYWCSWAMTDTTDQALRAAVRDAGWQPRPTAAEATVHTPETLATVPALGSGQRMWLFDGLLVDSQQVLTTMGLAQPVYV